MSDDDFQLSFQASRLLRSSMTSISKLLQSPPWVDLIVVDVSQVDPSSPDMIVDVDGGTHEPQLPTFVVREGLTGLQARLAESLPAALARRQELLRRTATVAFAHHRAF